MQLKNADRMMLPRSRSSNGAFVEYILLWQEPRLERQPDTAHFHHKLAAIATCALSCALLLRSSRD
jgi:hypothetical protein